MKYKPQNSSFLTQMYMLMDAMDDNKISLIPFSVFESLTLDEISSILYEINYNQER